MNTIETAGPFNEGKRATDFVRFEVSDYSRDVVTIVSGSGALEPGAVLGKVTATGEYAPYDPAGADGTETADAVLLYGVNATDAAKAAVTLRRHAVVGFLGLVFDAVKVTTTAQKQTAVDALEALGILTRQSV